MGHLCRKCLRNPPPRLNRRYRRRGAALLNQFVPVIIESMISKPHLKRRSRPTTGASFFLARRGLSRSEIFTTLGVVTIGLTLLVLFISRSRTSNRARECEARQIELGRTLLFQAQISGQFVGSVQSYPGVKDERRIAWPVAILPYLSRPLDRTTGELPGKEVVGRYATYHENLAKLTPEAGQAQLSQMYLREFVCPEDPRTRTASGTAATNDSPASTGTAVLTYVLNCGLPDASRPSDFSAKEFWPDYPNNGIGLDRIATQGDLSTNSLQGVDDGDGLAFTLLLSENSDATLWTEANEAASGFLWSTFLGADSEPDKRYPLPQVLQINEERSQGKPSRLASEVRHARPSSFHSEPGKQQPIRGVFVLYCDGHTKFITQQIDKQLFVALMTPDGTHTRLPGTGEKLATPWSEDRTTTQKEP